MKTKRVSSAGPDETEDQLEHETPAEGDAQGDQQGTRHSSRLRGTRAATTSQNRTPADGVIKTTTPGKRQVNKPAKQEAKTANGVKVDTEASQQESSEDEEDASPERTDKRQPNDKDGHGEGHTSTDRPRSSRRERTRPRWLDEVTRPEPGTRASKGTMRARKSPSTSEASISSSGSSSSGSSSDTDASDFAPATTGRKSVRAYASKRNGPSKKIAAAPVKPAELPPLEPLPTVMAIDRPEQPPIIIPTDAFGQLTSVYNILRAFSWQLRLSPFTLEDLCISIATRPASCLLDEVHVCVLRTLALHETTSQRRLRRLDLAMLDHVTWPEFVWEWLELVGAGELLRLRFVDGAAAPPRVVAAAGAPAAAPEHEASKTKRAAGDGAGAVGAQPPGAAAGASKAAPTAGAGAKVADALSPGAAAGAPKAAPAAGAVGTPVGAGSGTPKPALAADAAGAATAAAGGTPGAAAAPCDEPSKSAAIGSASAPAGGLHILNGEGFTRASLKSSMARSRPMVAASSCMHQVDYLSLPMESIAAILAHLCDDLLDVPALRNEINRREDLGCWHAGPNGAGGIFPMHTKESREAQKRRNEEDDGNIDQCVLCAMGGSLLCCDGCPAAYHLRCIGETSKSIPEGEWLCPECRVGGKGEGGGLRVPAAGQLPQGVLCWAAYGAVFEARGREQDKPTTKLGRHACHKCIPAPMTRYTGVEAGQHLLSMRPAARFPEDRPHPGSVQPLRAAARQAAAAQQHDSEDEDADGTEAPAPGAAEGAAARPSISGPTTATAAAGPSASAAASAAAAGAAAGPSTSTVAAGTPAAPAAATAAAAAATPVTPSAASAAAAATAKPAGGATSGKAGAGASGSGLVVAVEPPKPLQHPDMYLNRYRNAWTSAVLAIRSAAEHASKAAKKGQGPAPGPLPAPLPLSRFVWPLSQGKGSGRSVARCGRCMHCMRPQMKRPCLAPVVRQDGPGTAESVPVVTRLSPLINYLLKVERELWGLLGGAWALGEGRGLEHRHAWASKVSSANSVQQLAALALQLEEAIQKHLPILSPQWEGTRRTAPASTSGTPASRQVTPSGPSSSRTTPATGQPGTSAPSSLRSSPTPTPPTLTSRRSSSPMPPPLDPPTAAPAARTSAPPEAAHQGPSTSTAARVYPTPEAAQQGPSTSAPPSTSAAFTFSQAAPAALPHTPIATPFATPHHAAPSSQGTDPGTHIEGGSDGAGTSGTGGTDGSLRTWLPAATPAAASDAGGSSGMLTGGSLQGWLAQDTPVAGLTEDRGTSGGAGAGPSAHPTTEGEKRASGRPKKLPTPGSAAAAPVPPEGSMLPPSGAGKKPRGRPPRDPSSQPSGSKSGAAKEAPSQPSTSKSGGRPGGGERKGASAQRPQRATASAKKLLAEDDEDEVELAEEEDGSEGEEEEEEDDLEWLGLTKEDDPDDLENALGWMWWRNRSARTEARMLLPHHMAQRLGRQGGLGKMPARFQKDGLLMIPRLRWVAGVQQAGSCAQLALQLRVLDKHINWEALRRPAPDAPVAQFATATIRERREVAAPGSGWEYLVVLGEEPVEGAGGDEAAAGQSPRAAPTPEQHVVAAPCWHHEQALPLWLIKQYEEQRRREDAAKAARAAAAAAAAAREAAREAAVAAFREARKDSAASAKAAAAEARARAAEAASAAAAAAAASSENSCATCGAMYGEDPADKDLLWIACDSCNRWYHGGCVSVTQAYVDAMTERDKWDCPSCSGAKKERRQRAVEKARKRRQSKGIVAPVVVVDGAQDKEEKEEPVPSPGATDAAKPKKQRRKGPKAEQAEGEEPAKAGPGKKKRGAAATEEPELFCVCQEPYDEQYPMVGCDGCQGWFHPDCVGTTYAEAKAADNWFCPLCITQKQNKRKRKAAEQKAADAAAADAAAAGAAQVPTTKKKQDMAATGLTKSGTGKVKVKLDSVGSAEAKPKLKVKLRTLESLTQTEEVKSGGKQKKRAREAEEAAAELPAGPSTAPRPKKKARTEKAEAAAELPTSGTKAGTKQKVPAPGAAGKPPPAPPTGKRPPPPPRPGARERARVPLDELLMAPQLPEPAPAARSGGRGRADAAAAAAATAEEAKPRKRKGAPEPEIAPGATKVKKERRDDAAATAGTSKAAAGRAAAAKALEQHGGTAAPVAMVDGGDWVRPALKVLAWVMKQPYGVPFAEPVPEGVPLYYEMVKRPMDLGTVRELLRKHQYASPEQVLTDVALVWANCRKFNERSSPIVAHCIEAQAAFEERWKAAELPWLGATKKPPKAAAPAAAPPAAEQGGGEDGGDPKAGGRRRRGGHEAGPSSSAPAAADLEVPEGAEHKPLKIKIKMRADGGEAEAPKAHLDKSPGKAGSSKAAAAGGERDRGRGRKEPAGSTAEAAAELPARRKGAAAAAADPTPSTSKSPGAARGASKPASKVGAEEGGEAPQGRAAVGSRVGIWWPDDACYYYAVLEDFRRADRKHLVHYDDDVSEWLSLAAERVEWVRADGQTDAEAARKAGNGKGGAAAGAAAGASPKAGGGRREGTAAGGASAKADAGGKAGRGKARDVVAAASPPPVEKRGAKGTAPGAAGPSTSPPPAQVKGAAPVRSSRGRDTGAAPAQPAAPQEDEPAHSPRGAKVRGTAAPAPMQDEGMAKRTTRRKAPDEEAEVPAPLLQPKELRDKKPAAAPGAAHPAPPAASDGPPSKRSARGRGTPTPDPTPQDSAPAAAAAAAKGKPKSSSQPEVPSLGLRGPPEPAPGANRPSKRRRAEDAAAAGGDAPAAAPQEQAKATSGSRRTRDPLDAPTDPTAGAAGAPLTKGSSRVASPSPVPTAPKGSTRAARRGTRDSEEAPPDAPTARGDSRKPADVPKPSQEPPAAQPQEDGGNKRSKRGTTAAPDEPAAPAEEKRGSSRGAAAAAAAAATSSQPAAPAGTKRTVRGVAAAAEEAPPDAGAVTKPAAATAGTRPGPAAAAAGAAAATKRSKRGAPADEDEGEAPAGGAKRSRRSAPADEEELGEPAVAAAATRGKRSAPAEVEGPGEAATAGGAKRGKRGAPAEDAPAAGPSSPNGRASKRQQTVVEQVAKPSTSQLDKALQVLQGVMALPCAQPFVAPVPPNTSGYSEAVPRPMDLGTIAAKLHAQHYRAVSAVARDVALVWSNSRSFHKKQSKTWRLGEEAEAAFMEAWQQAGLPKMTL